MKFIAFFLLFLTAAPTYAAQPFTDWVADFKKEAAGKGISSNLLDNAFVNITPNEKVIRLDRKQPEGTMTFSKYKKLVISDSRIARGKRRLEKHNALLEEVAAKYGVQKRFIIALWGIETSYGEITGGFNIIEALATLAHEGRRASFFKKELFNALTIIDQGHISLEDMKGSWAGAMGQCQFMPSSFLAYAVDYDGDGKKDIWNSLPDTFGSIANYLSSVGWNDDLTWGREVKLSNAKLAETHDKKTLTLSQWAAKGVTKLDGSPLPNRDIKATLRTPGDLSEGAYLTYHNYDVILRWNRSDYFATAVGMVSDQVGY